MNDKLKKIVLVTAAVAVTSLAVAAILFFTTGGYRGWDWTEPGGIEVKESESFSLQGLAEINVQTSSIDVLVIESPGSSLELLLHGSVFTGRKEAIPHLSAVQRDDVLEVTTQQEDGKKFVVGFFSSDLVLELRVPAAYSERVVVRTSSGDIELSSLRVSTLTTETSSGDQLLEDLEVQQSQLTSTSGRIRAEAFRGAARAKSSSGDITLSYEAFDGDLEIRSSSGDVRLFLTDEADFRLQAKASSGDIQCDFPVTLAGAGSEMSNNTLNGLIGEGAHQVMVTTSSGDITIRP
jgi:lia operon protein LiaG